MGIKYKVGDKVKLLPYTEERAKQFPTIVKEMREYFNGNMTLTIRSINDKRNDGKVIFTINEDYGHYNYNID